MYKRWISFLLALVLTVSLVFPGEAVAVTAGMQENGETFDTSVTEPSDATEATGATESSEPTETTEATEPSNPTEATEATEPSNPTEATEATEPSEPTEATDTTEPSDPTEATDATEPSEPTEATDATEPSEPTEVTDATEPSEPTEATDTTEPSEPTEATEATEPSNPTEATDATEPGEPTEVTDATEPSEPAEATEATDPSAPTEAADVTEPTEAVSTDDGKPNENETVNPEDLVPSWIEDTLPVDQWISVTSLLPIKEVKAYLVLNDKTEEEIKAMPLSEVLSKLQDSNGNYIEVNPDATVVWAHFKDDAGNVIRDEYHEIGRGETVDLSEFEHTTGYLMELIVGTANQLDANNVRYLVRVYITSTIAESRDYVFYKQDENGNRTKVNPRNTKTDIISQLGISATSTVYMVPEHVEGTEYYLGITSLADEHPNIAVDFYTFEQFMYYLMGGASMATPFTSQALNQDMTVAGAGYKSVFDAAESAYDQKNVFAAVYTDIRTNSMISYDVFALTIVDDVSYLDSEMFTYDENGQKLDIVTLSADDFMAEDLNIDFAGGVTGLYMEGRYFMLSPGYSADSELYFSLDAHSNYWEDDANGHVVKAAVGLYYALDEAADAEDIKDQLIPVDRSGVYGYKANYAAQNGGVDFTVFFDDDTIFRFNVRAMDYDPKYDPDYMPDFSNAPIVGEADPWFRVTGARDENGAVLDTYIVENGKAINMDTMYGYGYQTILVNDVTADLSKLQPTIWLANEERIKVYVNGVLYEAGNFVDCSKGPVQFTAIIDGNQKNYQVTFVQKATGSDLCVIGPATHEVFLDEYFEYKHDILIANLGDSTLTGLRVELNATNCKLDDYWTIGGEGNNTLAPFDATSTDTMYGELANLAKIRLLPDGDGDIEGTLTVYADGQEPVTINLTGQAQNPKITTTQESFSSYTAVKYVPYAYLISTNNMYDWTDVTFTLTGELPEGMEFYPETGEIYGVPQETGEFTILVEATFSSDTYEFESSSVELTLNVLENTNENVYLASDANYQIKQHVGTQTGDYDFVLETIEDTVFTSHGEFGEFVAVWLNGKQLVEGVHYTKEEGSTKITIKSQTLEEETNEDGSENTIAMEFRTDTDGDGNANDDGDLNRTAQNFTVDTQSAVDKVIAMIDALPTNVTLGDKSAVQAARSAYNALSSDQKAKVTNYSKLTAAEDRIAQLERDYAAANKVIDKINDLPSTIHLSDKAAVEAARAAYDALTTAQKNLVTNYSRLLEAEAAIAQLEAEHEENEKNKAAAKVVVDLIEALPVPVTLADKEAVAAARAAYNNLTAAQKGYVTNYNKLTEAEATIAALEAEEKAKAEVNAVIALINAIPSPVTLEDKPAVEKARAAYDALTPEQQAGVVNYKTLLDAEATIAALEAQQEADEADRAAAEAVIALIDALPDPLTLEDKPAVEAAREAYENLTDAQKQLVTNYSDLLDAEAAIKALEDYLAAEEEDRAAADVVIDLIDAIPEDVTLEDKEQVEDAREAYDDLTEKQQEIVTNYDELEAAEVKIAELENSEYEEKLSVTLVALFVDREGKSLSDTVIELHSVVQTGRTDENGSILFTGVEFGGHTVYTKDEAGNITSQKSFSIVQGTPLGMDGDIITAENGAVFTITIQKDGSSLAILSIEEGNQAPEVDTDKDDEDNGIDIGDPVKPDKNPSKNPDKKPGSTNPDTGDDSNLALWGALMLISLIGIVAVSVNPDKKRRKCSNNR